MNRPFRKPRRGEPGFAEAHAKELLRERQKLEEEQERAAADRRRYEEAVRIDRAERVVRFIRVFHNLGIVQLEGSSADHLFEGLHTVLDRPKTRGRLLVLPARGFIQGKGVDEEAAEAHLKQISEHRREHGELAILAYEGFNFKDTRSKGSPVVARRIKDVLTRQSTSVWSALDTPIIIAGPGTEENLPVTPGYVPSKQNPLAALLNVTYALDAQNELTTAPQISADNSKLDRNPVLLPPTFQRGSVRKP